MWNIPLYIKNVLGTTCELMPIDRLLWGLWGLKTTIIHKRFQTILDFMFLLSVLDGIHLIRRRKLLVLITIYATWKWWTKKFNWLWTFITNIVRLFIDNSLLFVELVKFVNGWCIYPLEWYICNIHLKLFTYRHISTLSPWLIPIPRPKTKNLKFFKYFQIRLNVINLK